MKRMMCVYLPNWPLQRLAQQQPALRRKTVVIIDPQAPRGPKVVLASRQAFQAGVRSGMPLAEALALVPDLSVCQDDPEADRRCLLELAQFCQRYSPIAALEDSATPESLLLDITGCAGCFGGEDRLVEQARAQLAGAGWTVRVAVADTAGAAWALAHHGDSVCRAEPGQGAALLQPLPLAALRLPPETLALLAQLGLRRVGDLLHLSRHDLAARFGTALLERLDQALGQRSELIVPPPPTPELQAQTKLDFPIERFDAICVLLEHLVEELHRLLRRRNLGARQLECTLLHETAPATQVALGLYRPSAEPAYLTTLLRTRLEQVQLPAPVAGMRLRATVAEPLAEMQRAIFEAGGKDEAALAGLIDRLSTQLGRRAVTRPRCVPDPQPELAFRFEPLLQPRSAAVRVKERARPRRPAEKEPAAPRLRRPLSMWPEPRSIEVRASSAGGLPQWIAWPGAEHCVVHGWGPERIETGWWRGDDVGRDYYVVTTEDGSRLWLFRRRDGRWFLHGCFD